MQKGISEYGIVCERCGKRTIIGYSEYGHIFCEDCYRKLPIKVRQLEVHIKTLENQLEKDYSELQQQIKEYVEADGEHG